MPCSSAHHHERNTAIFLEIVYNRKTASQVAALHGITSSRVKQVVRQYLYKSARSRRSRGLAYVDLRQEGGDGLYRAVCGETPRWGGTEHPLCDYVLLPDAQLVADRYNVIHRHLPSLPPGVSS